MLTKVTKHSKNNKVYSTIRFCRALDNSKQDVTTYKWKKTRKFKHMLTAIVHLKQQKW